MAQYINKDVLVAEIERQYNYLREHPGTYGAGFILGFRQAGWQISDFIDTIEVKEVDLEDEKCKDLNDDGTCIYAFNKTGKVMRCEYIKCSRKIKAQKGE